MRNLPIVLALCLCAAIARADDTRDIRATYDKMCAAMQRKDAAAITALEAPGFVAMVDGRKLTGPQLAHELKAGFAAQGKVHYMRINMRTLAVHGKTAAVTSDFYYEAEAPAPTGGKAPRPRKPHVINLIGSFSNTLVRSPHGWRFLSLAQRTARATLDGKPLPPKR